MYIDYKCTIWQRLYFRDTADVNLLIKELENGSYPSDLCDEEYGFNELDMMFDTEEFILPIENDGQSTIEIYEETEKFSKCIWDNSIKK